MNDALTLPESLLLAQPLELTLTVLEGSPERVELALRVALRLALELASGDRERAALGDGDVEIVGRPRVELTQAVVECVALLNAERENEPTPEAVTSPLSVAEAEKELRWVSLDDADTTLESLELALAHVLFEELGDALELVESLPLKLADALDAALSV